MLLRFFGFGHSLGFGGGEGNVFVAFLVIPLSLECFCTFFVAAVVDVSFLVG